MVRSLGVLVLVMAVVGCDAGAKKSDCSRAVASLAKPLPDAPLTDAQLRELGDAIKKRCTEDKWSPGAIECLAKVTDDAGKRDCMYKHLTPQAKDKLAEAMWPYHGRNTRALAKMREFTEAMCACEDAACAQRVSDVMTKWSQEQSRYQQELPKMTEEEGKEAAAIGLEMGRCMQNAMGVPTPPNRAEVDRVMAKMEEFKDAMCACKDAKCATKVTDDMTVWSQQEAKNTVDPLRMSKTDTERAADIGEQMGACMQKAMGAR